MVDLSEDTLYDCVIVRGGPAGLTAGLYCARAKMKTLLFEKGTLGGQIAITDLVENYPGFILAVGSNSRRLGVLGEEEFLNRGVFMEGVFTGEDCRSGAAGQVVVGGGYIAALQAEKYI